VCAFYSPFSCQWALSRFFANHDDEFGLRFTNEKIQEKARPQPGLKIFILFNTDYCVLTQPDFEFDHSY
jgi:hypothetical protein